MATYKKIYEGNTEKHELTFRGEIFDFSMVTAVFGRESNKDSFLYQIHDKFNELSIEDLEETGMDDLWCEEDEDEIFQILDELEKME